MTQCVLCHEEFEAGDQISPSTWHTLTGTHRAHAECGLREVAGGIGHHLNHDYWCEVMHDPDGGLSYRESALRVWQLYQQEGVDR